MNSSLDIQKQALLEHLILQGAVEISGVDNNTGEMIYSITDKLKEVSPEIYYNIEKDFEERMFQMIEQGPTIMQWKLSL